MQLAWINFLGTLVKCNPYLSMCQMKCQTKAGEKSNKQSSLTVAKFTSSCSLRDSITVALRLSRGFKRKNAMKKRQFLGYKQKQFGRKLRHQI